MSVKVQSPRRNDERFSCFFSASTGDVEAWYDLPYEPDAAASDSFFIAALLPAMTLGGDLEVAEPVSPRLLHSIGIIEDIYLNWNRHQWPNQPRFARVRIRAPRRPVLDAAPHERKASFFTAGVDSFYTALKHLDEIDALIYVRGFDTGFADYDVLRRTLPGIRTAAAELGKPLIELTSNLRQVCSNYIGWGPYHGAALASAATLLSGHFQRVFIPSSYNYANLPPWGSHPLLDPLWSTEQVEIVHDGCEVSRIEKLEKISKSFAARSWLRVCLENREGAYNCGSCEKCLRTMTALRIIGRLDAFTTFPEFDAAHMTFASRPRVPEALWRSFWGTLLEMVQESARDKELENGIRRVLSQTPLKNGKVSKP